MQLIYNGFMKKVYDTLDIRKLHFRFSILHAARNFAATLMQLHRHTLSILYARETLNAP